LYYIVANEEIVWDSYRENICIKEISPYIIHYDGLAKPWSHFELPLAAHFWERARQTAFYREILVRNLFKRYIFPFHAVRKSDKIVLYGAGAVGVTFHRQIAFTEYCEIRCWCDKNHMKLSLDGYDVSNPEAILSCAFDCVVIAVDDKRIANEIRKMLNRFGVTEEKIIWENPQN
jgi:hypothetical protein